MALTLETPVGFAGQLLHPGDPGYDEARLGWNGMFDRHPAVVARCAAPSAVVAALAIARDQGLDVTVRGGGHGVTGAASADGALQIDLTPMKRIDVDPAARTAIVGGGVTWGELDAATQEHGLAVTGGRVSHTGVGGLTLGSGSGWLERAYGLTADNLLAATVVTADGRVVRASEDEHADLFFALRGGGGNFGIVTDFEFRLHPVGPMIAGGLILHPLEDAETIMRAYRDLILAGPEEVGGAMALMSVPPAPFVPPELVGRRALGIIVMHTGGVEEGLAALQPIRDLGTPLAEHVGPMPYVALQQLIDPGNPWRSRGYFKAAFMDELTDGAIHDMVQLAPEAPSPMTVLLLQPLGGAYARVDEDATALGFRDTQWVWHALSVWMDPSEDEANLEFTRLFGVAMDPHSRKAVHPNYVSDQGAARVESFYTPRTWERLTAAKRRWDPQNVFKYNQNIPAG